MCLLFTDIVKLFYYRVPQIGREDEVPKEIPSDYESCDDFLKQAQELK